MGQRSPEIMSTHTLQAQGRRSTVALPEKIKAHRECRPGTKSKNIAPYGRGTKVIGKADRGARQHPGTSMFQKGENQFHKLRVSRGRSPQTTMFQEDKFQNLRASGGYLRIPNGPTEATGVISTTAHIQSTLRVVHLQRTECDVLLNSVFETAKQRFTSACNIYRSSRVIALIPRNLQEKSTGPTRSEHEALESLRFQRRIVRDYKFLHDVHRYLRVVRRRIGLHASTKGLVPPEEGMRKIAVFTRLLSSTELLHPKVRV
ncbi:hypothetical protein YC2023_066536 [Brassica napus]